MNSDFVVKMSTLMAEAISRQQPTAVRDQLRLGWQLSFGQPPTAQQLATAQAFLERQTRTLMADKLSEADAQRTALATYCQALLGSNRFLYIE